MRLQPPARFVERFSDALLQLDLPQLPPDRRRTTVMFVGRRVADLPDPIAAGVALVTTATGAAGALIGDRRLAAFARSRSLPGLGDLVRLVRSLAYAVIWERWPDTGADGRAAPR